MALPKMARRRLPNASDADVGRRVRALRIARRMSQTKLADRLQITFQQVQKYEKGSNRISAGRLQGIADALGVPVSFFFSSEDSGVKAIPENMESVFEFMNSAKSLQLLKSFSEIKDPEVKTAIVHLVERLAKN